MPGERGACAMRHQGEAHRCRMSPAPPAFGAGAAAVATIEPAGGALLG